MFIFGLGDALSLVACRLFGNTAEIVAQGPQYRPRMQITRNKKEMAEEVARRKNFSESLRSKSYLSSISLGLMFITLGCCRIFLIRLSIRDGQYEYLPVTVNIMAEILKFFVCGLLSGYVLVFEESKTFKKIFSNVQWLQLLKWAVPGLLYFFDNLLGFYILVHLPPAVYSLLGNFVIISTAVLFRVVLRRKLSQVQWAALMILFLSIMTLSHQQHDTGSHHVHRIINHIPNTAKSGSPSQKFCHSFTGEVKNASQSAMASDDMKSLWGFKISTGCLLALLQCLLSSSANIYNEKIFKEDSGFEESIYVQNTKLYMFGIFFNSVILFVNSEFRSHVTNCGFFYGYNIHASLLIICTAAFGLTVALILKFRDNMFQVMSFQLTNVVVITLSVMFLDFSPTLDFFLNAPVVLLAIFVYHSTRRKQDSLGDYESVSTDSEIQARDP